MIVGISVPGYLSEVSLSCLGSVELNVPEPDGVSGGEVRAAMRGLP